jgi:hypothetical protein
MFKAATHQQVVIWSIIYQIKWQQSCCDWEHVSAIQSYALRSGDLQKVWTHGQASLKQHKDTCYKKKRKMGEGKGRNMKSLEINDMNGTHRLYWSQGVVCVLRSIVDGALHVQSRIESRCMPRDCADSGLMTVIHVKLNV